MNKEQGILRGLFEYLPFQYELFCLLNLNLFSFFSFTFIDNVIFLTKRKTKRVLNVNL